MCFGIRVFATLLIDRGIIPVFEGETPLAAIIKTGLERARERAKTLKGLKTKNPDRDARGCPVCVDLQPLFMNLVRRKRLWSDRGEPSPRSTDFKSIREADKIFYGERALMAFASDRSPSRLR